MASRIRQASMRRAAAASFAAAMAAVAASGALGQEVEPPSPQLGRTFAQRFCSNCHLVEGSQNPTAQAGIPSLRGIANKPGQSGQHILDILIKPHPPMPDMQISNREIVDLLAYLETLRTDRSSPPLIAPAPSGEKPIYPKPS